MTAEAGIALTFEEIREIAQQAAGLGAACVMQEAPDVVMPTEKIIEGVEEILREKGVAG